MRIALIGQPNYRHTKRLILWQLRALPHDFIIFDTHDGATTMIGDDLPKNVQFLEVPKLDMEALLPALAGLSVDQIISFSDRGVVPAAQLRETRRLQGNSVDTENIVVNKAATRKRLCEAGLSRVQHRITDPTHLERDAADFAVPFIVKPTSASGSLGVELVQSHEDLPGYLSRYRNNKILGAAAGIDQKSSFNNGALVLESFIDGNEFSVEGVVIDGRILFLGITASHTSQVPFFVGIGHDFQPCRPSDELENYTQSVVNALGMTFCPFHIEMMKTSSGYEVIEAHTRFGGGLMMELVAAGTGFSPFSGYIELLLGKEFSGLSEASGVFSQHYLCTEEAGPVDRISLSNAVINDPRIISYALDYNPGDVIESGVIPLCRLGYVTFSAKNAHEAQAFRSLIDSHLEIQIQAQGLVQSGGIS